MFEKIINLDKAVFVFLNSLGSNTFDGFCLFITKQINWAPLFIVVFYYLQKKNWLEKFSILHFIYKCFNTNLRPNS